MIKLFGYTCRNSIEEQNIQNKLTSLTSPKITFPKELRTFGSADIRNLLTISSYIDIADELYSSANRDDVLSFLQLTGINKEIFKNEVHDCDDFAREFWTSINKDENGTYNYSLAYARSTNHAFNILIDEKNQIWIIEPQNGNSYKLEEVISNPSQGNTDLVYWPITMILFP